MSTAYQPSMVALDNHQNGYHYPSTVTYGRRAQGNSLVNPQASRHTSQAHVSHVPSNWQPKDNTFAPMPQQSLTSVQSNRPSTSTPEAALTVSRETTSSRRSSETLVYHSLRIPSCISPNGGNLADFAAQMTCLFWFQSANVLKQAETIRSKPALTPLAPLPTLARPVEQFRKWVYTVLSTTQVTQNVILLALLFIYRLKMSTPKINGRAGSEYRLLTVALMLGNKFLDDNTYTNKTWAEVSAFSVKEIHVMEVEFLSNMRYNLLASKEEWEAWIEKLACFHDYYDRASRLPSSPTHTQSPTHPLAYSPMPSPTAGDMAPITPTLSSNISPSSRHSHNWSTYAANAVSPLASKPAMALPASRKRSWEEETSDHPAKRHVPFPSIHGTTSLPSNRLAVQPEPPRLSIPQLSLVTSQSHTLPNPTASLHGTPQYPAQTGSFAPSIAIPPMSNHVSLPPLQPGMRAMSTVYQQPMSVLHQQSMPLQTPVTLPSTGITSTLPSQAPIQFTANKHPSPGSLAHYSSSPMPDQYGGGSTLHTPLMHTPMSISPSIYLQQRNSPYKPIRHVNTLLYPPPSASLDQYHLSAPLQPAQMHYQPLGRRNDLRTGIVPDFLVYNRGQQQHQLPSQGMPQGHYPS